MALSQSLAVLMYIIIGGPCRKLGPQVKINACLAARIIQGGSQGVEQVGQGAGVEEVPQLHGEQPELLHEVPAEVRAGRRDALEHLLGRDQVLWTSIPVQLVLQRTSDPKQLACG